MTATERAAKIRELFIEVSESEAPDRKVPHSEISRLIGVEYPGQEYYNITKVARDLLVSDGLFVASVHGIGYRSFSADEHHALNSHRLALALDRVEEAAESVEFLLARVDGGEGHSLTRAELSLTRQFAIDTRRTVDSVRVQRITLEMSRKETLALVEKQEQSRAAISDKLVKEKERSHNKQRTIVALRGKLKRAQH